MSERVTMPALGESVTEGTVTTWLKKVGDTVEVDEPLLEVSTDKVDTEIPSPVAGTLQEILVEEDETVEVGADLAVVGDGDAPSGSGSSEDESEAESEGESEAEPEPAEEVSDTQQKKQSDEAEPESKESAEETPAEPSVASEEPAQKPKPSTSSSSSGGEEVQMPALGESVTEGTVTQWLKSEGDQIEVDEPLLEVSTDKVDTEIPSPVAGTLTKILVAEDETVEVGAPLAIVGGESSGGGGEQEEPSASQEDAVSEPTTDKDEEPAPEVEPEVQGTSAASEESPKQESAKESAPADESKKASDKEVAQPPSQAEEQDASAYVTPLVRKLAADNDIDLSTLKGTGVGGRIRKQDVLDAARAAEEATKAEAEPEKVEETEPEAQKAPAPQKEKSADAAPAASAPPVSDKRGTSEKMTRLRKIIAERMVESLSVSAQLTAVVEVDMSRVAALRAKSKAEFERREGAKLSYLPFISLATVETLKAFPQVNCSVEGDSIVYHGGEHLGVAVDTERGLLVPVIRDAGDLNIAGIARKIADLAERTRTNKVTPDELGGGTFTITNIGSNGSLLDTPIINQPQVGILGTGAIVKRPVVVQDADGNDSIAIRSMCYLVLTYDHRVVDGALAGKFLSTLKKRLEEGAFDV